MEDVVRILVVAGCVLHRVALASFLRTREGVWVVSEASSCEQALEMARELRPTVVLLDVRPPYSDGFEVAREIRRAVATAKVVIVTPSDRREDLLAALRAGAAGYLLDSILPEELVRVIQVVSDGEVVLSGRAAESLMAEIGIRKAALCMSAQAPVTSLTKREREILHLIAKGKSNREIGISLCISETTAKTHVRNILRKLNVNNRMQAVLQGRRIGLVEAEDYEEMPVGLRLMA